MRTAVIYQGPAGTRVERPDITIVGADDADLMGVACRLVADGADRIELCGGVGAAEHAAVVHATGPGVPVGLNRYAFESLELITDYKTAYRAGEHRPGAFVYLSPGADPDRDRTEHEGLTFVAVPDETSVGAVAAGLAGDGVRLIELYAGLGTAAAAAALRTTAGRVPVGVTGYDG